MRANKHYQLQKLCPLVGILKLHNSTDFYAYLNSWNNTI
jgi:hypothetical protein